MSPLMIRFKLVQSLLWLQIPIDSEVLWGSPMPAWLELAGQILLLGGMIAGLLGLVVPFFPGITVIWAFCIIYGIFFGFGGAGIWLFVLITLLAIFGWIADNVFMGAKARQSGAHWLSILVAFIVGFIASILITPVGGIIAALAGIFLVEYAYEKDADAALKTMQGFFSGFGWAFAMRFVAGALMITIWGVWAILYWR